MDYKSIGLCPREFESLRCRFFAISMLTLYRFCDLAKHVSVLDVNVGERVICDVKVKTNIVLLEAGLEPAISSLGGRRLIH